MAKLINPETLASIIVYEPNTGKLSFSSDKFAFVNAGIGVPRRLGKECFNRVGAYGYLHGDIAGRPYMAHRVAWAIYYGYWPEFIDHINGNRCDNKIENLRAVSKTENNRNKRISHSNKTGSTGVNWHKRDQRWYATISNNGRQIHLGYFDTKEMAVFARLSAERDYGYHPNHGRVC